MPTFYPTEENFIQSLSPEEKEKYNRLVKYSKPTLTNSDSCFEIYQQKCSEAKKIRQKLEILIAQEKPKSTESEEQRVKYWSDEYTKFQISDTSEQNLLINLQQIEDNFKKAQEQYNKSKATVEARLQVHRQNRHGTEQYYKNRIQKAQQEYDDRRNHKSAPRIKLEMEYAEPRKFIDSYNAEMNGIREWEEYYKEFKIKQTAWTKDYWRRRDEEESKPTPPTPRIVKGMKTAKKASTYEAEQREALCKEVLYDIITQVEQRLQEPNGLEGYSSEVAYLRAKTEQMV